MNQLTVMLNGNGQGPGGGSHQPSAPGQAHASQGAQPQFFIQGGQLQGATLTLPDTQMLQLQQGQTTLMVPQSAAGFQQSPQVQYILTPQQQQQPQPGQIMANAMQTQQFGLMPNLMGVNVIQPQQTQLVAAGQLQPTFMTMTNQPQLQLQTSNAPPTLFSQPSQQFHMQNSGSSAILSNPQLTLSAQPTTQFILNQAVTPQPQSNPQQQQMYQLVLPNGQVIQTLQQPMMAMQPQQQQQQTITVPLQQPGQLNQILAPATLTTFLAPNAPQPQQQLQLIASPPAPQPSPISTVFNQHQQNHSPQQAILGAIQQQTPGMQTQGLVITASPMQGPTSSSSTPQMSNHHHHHHHHPPSNQTNPPSSSTTTMMVLTSPISGPNTSTSSLIPPAVLDHKTIKTEPPRINGEKVTNIPQPIVAMVTPAPEPKPASDTTKNVTVPLCNGEVRESPKPKPVAEGLKETKSFGQQTSFELPEELMRNIDVSGEELITIHKLRPNSAASSCGSLKIDEQEEKMDEDTEVETEPETETPTEDKCKESSTSPMTTLEVKKDSTETDKEGYQSSYGGSPCHFTDTEDEEEEEEDEEVEENGEIKLTKRRRLTQAAYNLINNRILSSDQEDTTNQSIDSKCSITSQEVCAYNNNNNNNNNSENGEKVSIQIQTSATPSPASVISNTSSQAEPESTTMNTLFSNEKTILNSESCVVDGVNVDEIRDFAKSFKLCRLALGLTQSQVGLELSALNGPCYSQSAICRFEKLDITPKSAKKIKPVLENWMRDAQEKYKNHKLRSAGLLADGGTSSPSSDSESGFYKVTSASGHHPLPHHHKGSPSETISSMHHIESGKKRKRRTSFQPAALEALNKFFKENPHPSGPEMTKMAQYLGYQRDVVRVWFCNKRQTLRNKNQMPQANEMRQKQGSPIPNNGPQKLSDLTKKDDAAVSCLSVQSSTASSNSFPTSQPMPSLACSQSYSFASPVGTVASHRPPAVSMNGGSAFKPVVPPSYSTAAPPPPAVFTPVPVQAIKSGITAPQLAPTYCTYSTPMAIATKSSGHAMTPPKHTHHSAADHSHPTTTNHRL